MARPLYALAAAVVVLALAIVLAAMIMRAAPTGQVAVSPSPVCRAGGQGGIPALEVSGTCPPGVVPASP